jgi:uncharacterized membrane protein YdjX (TVP38/TMEM64 family)
MSGNFWKISAALLLAGAGIAALALGGPELPRRAVAWVAGLGAMGPVVFIAIYIVACVFFVPGSILSLGAGFIWGVWAGTAIVSAASTLGATAAFLAGRYLLRDWVARRIAGNEKFRAVDEAVAREGWKIVGLTRLSPLFPFNLLNYAFGLTRVRLRDYVPASWIGMLPGTVLYVYLGSLAGDLSRIGAQTEETGWARWAVRIVGLAATAAVAIYAARLAKRTLQKKL